MFVSHLLILIMLARKMEPVQLPSQLQKHMLYFFPSMLLVELLA